MHPSGRLPKSAQKSPKCLQIKLIIPLTGNLA
jgi:hypothetical protein